VSKKQDKNFLHDWVLQELAEIFDMFYISNVFVGQFLISKNEERGYSLKSN